MAGCSRGGRKSGGSRRKIGGSSGSTPYSSPVGYEQELLKKDKELRQITEHKARRQQVGWWQYAMLRSWEEWRGVESAVSVCLYVCLGMWWRVMLWQLGRAGEEEEAPEIGVRGEGEGADERVPRGLDISAGLEPHERDVAG